MTTAPHRRLKPAIGVVQAVAFALAATSPTASVFLTYGSAWAVAGTGLVIGFLIGAVIAFGIALSYAEGASAYPYTTGGDYSIVAQALGRRVGSVYTSLFTFKGIVIPAVLSLATAAYIQAVIPTLPLAPTAVVVLLLVLVLSFEGIRVSSGVATAMVALESVVLIGFMVVAATHMHQPLSVLVHPVMSTGHTLVAATSAGIIASVVSALFAFNGWEASLYVSEETKTNPRGIGRTVVVNIGLIVGLEVVAIVLATLALPHLSLAQHSVIPLAVVVRSSMGVVGATALLVGVVVATFDSTLASTVVYGRIYYAIARDGHWPGGLNRFFLKLNRQGVPYGAFVVLGVINVAICLMSTLTSLVIFTGALLMVLYLGVSISSFATRRRAHPQFRMPWWPIPPAIGIVGILMVFSQLKLAALAIVLGMVAVGLVWSFAHESDAGQRTRDSGGEPVESPH